MEFSTTWSCGSVPSDFDFFMSFVAHVTDTYPTSVFDVAYRPVMLTGVMLTGGSEALQKRSAALARDAPMGFQLALGLTVSPKMPLICAILAATLTFHLCSVNPSKPSSRSPRLLAELV